MESAVIIKPASDRQFLRSLVHRSLQVQGSHTGALAAAIRSTSVAALPWLASRYSCPWSSGTAHQLLHVVRALLLFSHLGSPKLTPTECTSAPSPDVAFERRARS